ncbi:TPR-like protein [Saitoella complicata NRRL Y-17804]|uniref:Chromo domain-containing protein n=1 Tax=Saitoella complicata (strain BCRC 22490 / CBS 7301 / JCM 7358 / NBRC 10748 / NRRL Y-17804) TaxID=698492 RepID=A0A0E9NEH3_SAICN|nr:TPR-like protein [Saitoella complicata NRRL Y-17804]ODQ51388.1 TPR-like protein [Saitoella complicata NRRL Y-17804]GAO48244.1 hypothetical protein G7K_2424-t1 [Saitoella complicata NRRL Y-17804]
MGDEGQSIMHIDPQLAAMSGRPSTESWLEGGSSNEPDYQVEKILKKGFTEEGKRVLYLVRWKGYTEQYDSWEPRENLLVRERELVDELEERLKELRRQQAAEEDSDDESDDFSSDGEYIDEEAENAYSMPPNPNINVLDPDLWSDESEEDGDGEDALMGNTSLRSGMKQFGRHGDEDDDFENLRNDLRVGKGFKQKGKRKGRRGPLMYQPSVEVEGLLARANEFWIHLHDPDAARKIFLEIIRIDPRVVAAYQTLGTIYMDTGRPKEALDIWFLGAHHQSRNNEGWVTCAKLATQFAEEETEERTETQRDHYRKQAAYCYSRILSNKTGDVDALWERSILFRQLGKTQAAITGFKRLLDLLPYDMSISRELARIYSEDGNYIETIKLYGDSMQHYMQSSTIKPGSKFDFSELNILAEAYMEEERWSECIERIRSGARWLRGRRSETWWDEVGTDCEWDVDDERRRKAVEVINRRSRRTVGLRDGRDMYSLPVELKIKLGQCRLKLGEWEEGLQHLQVLEGLDPEQWQEPFLAAADACLEFAENCDDSEPVDEIDPDPEVITENEERERIKAAAYDASCSFYHALNECEATRAPANYMGLGRCCLALKEYEDAESCFSVVYTMLPNDIDSRVRLAEMYELLDRRDEALALINDVIRIRSEELAKLPAEALEKVEEEDDDDEHAIFKVTDRVRPNRWGYKRMRRQLERLRGIKIQNEEARIAATIERGKKLDLIREQMEAHDPVAVEEWVNTATELCEEFASVKSFYPGERWQKFKGLRFMQTKKKGMNERLEMLAHRLQESAAGDDSQTAWGEDPERYPTEFRGMAWDKWLHTFLQCAVLLATYGDILDAYKILDSAVAANVFYQNKEREVQMHLVSLACAIRANDAERGQAAARWFLQKESHTFDTFKMFYAAIGTGHDSLDTFVAGPSQKYFLRLVRQVDTVLDNKLSSKPNKTALQPPKKNITRYNPFALMTYGHMMAGNKSYVVALNYYLRAYAIGREVGVVDPMVCFSTAVAYLGQALKRQTDNRQYQIIQGFMFLLKYYDIRKEQGRFARLEAEYNMARAYHHLGLGHLAIPCYESALRLSDELHEGVMENTPEAKELERFDFRWEAAYNLQLVYIVAGNMKLAKKVTEKYLVL